MRRETSFSAWTYRYRENSIALGSKEPHQVAKNKFRTKFEKTSLSAQSFWWRCVSGKHPFTFRTRRLRPRRPRVLYWRRYGRVGGCQIKNKIEDEWLRPGRLLILADWSSISQMYLENRIQKTKIYFLKEKYILISNIQPEIGNYVRKNKRR